MIYLNKKNISRKLLLRRRGIFRLLTCFYTLLFISFSGIADVSAAPQQTGDDIVITGSVVDDETDMPLSGASVQVQGSNIGTTVDDVGKFRIEVPKGASIVVSFAGYETKNIKVTKSIDLNIRLTPENTSLTEVVVTALGIKKEKRRLGYAVQDVSGESMEKVKSPTATAALTGRIAGMNISNSTDLFSNPSISLRGRTPLIVVDGVPDPEADPWKINMDDVESVSVLKGTAAAALYGSIGINGAIMYTTKKGKKGKLQVEVNSSTLFQTGYTVIPKVQSTYGGGDNGQYAYVDGSGSGTEGGGWMWGPKLDQKDPNTPSGFFETPQYNSPIDENTGERIPLPWISRGKNNMKNYFRTGILSTNSISATSGNDKGSFRISASHKYQRGIMPNTSVNNSSFTVGGNYKLTDNLDVNTKLTYNKVYSDNYPVTGYGPPNILYNLVLWIGHDVDIRDLRDYWVPGEEGLQQRNYNLSWYNNPYFQAYELLNGYDKDNSFGQVTFDYRISDDLSLNVRNGFNAYGLNQDQKEPYSYIAYDYISKGNYSTTNSSYFDITSDVLLNYDHDFGEHFSLDAKVGFSNFYNTYKSTFATTDGLAIPEFYNLSTSTNPPKTTNVARQRRIMSVYGMIDMNLYRWINLSLTGRRDKVSTLPLDNNAYFYPSANASLILSDIINLPQPISYLKARGAWAMVNTGVIDQNDPYAQLLSYQIGNTWNNVSSLNWPSTAIAPGLKPATTRSTEVGLVVGLLNNRINIDATYYRNKDYNNLITVPQSQAKGYSALLTNALTFVRKGWELVVDATPVRDGIFKWKTIFNFSNNHRWLAKAEPGKDGYYNTYTKEGERTDGIYITNSVTPDGQPIYNTNGYEAYDPYGHFYGWSDPDWIYGWQNMFSYKDFTLSFSLDGRLGGLIYSTTNQKMWWGGQAPETVNHYREDSYQGNDTYIAPGVVVSSGSIEYDSHGNVLSDTRKFEPNTTPVNYPSFMQTTSGDMLNNYFYYSGTYIKLRELSLTYTLPQRWTSGFFNEASVSFIGNNLFLLAKIPNVDPDLGSDNLHAPSIRSVGMNINLKF